VGHKAKWEYFRAIYERYQKASRKLKQAILKEFCLNTGLPPGFTEVDLGTVNNKFYDTALPEVTPRGATGMCSSSHRET